MIKKLLYIIAVLLVAGSAFGADLYITPGTSGVGSFADPYSWSDATPLTAGNDYRQLCGTTHSGALSITNSGTEGNRIIVGAYNADGSHEDGKEVFGENCSGELAKPIIDDDLTGTAVDIVADYIELNSIHVKEGDRGIAVKGDGVVIKYCELSNGRGGIIGGLSATSTDSLYVGYNYMHTNWGHDEILDDLDGVQLSSGVDNATVEYNVIDDYAHACVAVSLVGAVDNEVKYNYCTSTTEVMDLFLAVNGTRTLAHHNYCVDCGIIQLHDCEGCSVYYNVIDGYNTNIHTKNIRQLKFFL
jgi:hypothetical protein